ncbi:MAG: cobalamin-dependent protein [Roseobacter sp.]
MSRHDHAIVKDNSNVVARVALRALSTLAPNNSNGPDNSEKHRSLADSARTDDLLDSLYFAAIGQDPAHFLQTFLELRRAGCSSDFLAFDLIPDVARRLGASWVDDVISFADVTIGCARLQSALRQLPDDVPTYVDTCNGVEQNCLVAVPIGAQHTMGAMVLAKQLRQARQRVVVDLTAHKTTLSHLAGQHDFDIVLISATSGENPAEVQALIETCRAHWGACKVIVGGSFCDLNDDVLCTVHADRFTNDWQEALDLSSRDFTRVEIPLLG